MHDPKELDDRIAAIAYAMEVMSENSDGSDEADDAWVTLAILHLELLRKKEVLTRFE